jgi:hypothetical protein
MDKELEKVKRRIDKRLEQYGGNDNDDAPFNDAMSHFEKIEGYPTKNLSKVNINSFPLPIRILGYILMGSMGVGILMFIILSIVK